LPASDVNINAWYCSSSILMTLIDDVIMQAHDEASMTNR